MSADAPALNEQVERLLDEGTGCYARGDVEGAVGRWREVLELEPGNGRAQAWLDRVRGELIEAFDVDGSEGPSDALRGAELELPELEEELGSLVGDGLSPADPLAAAEAALDAVSDLSAPSPDVFGEDPVSSSSSAGSAVGEDDLDDWLGGNPGDAPAPDQSQGAALDPTESESLPPSLEVVEERPSDSPIPAVEAPSESPVAPSPEVVDQSDGISASEGSLEASAALADSSAAGEGGTGPAAEGMAEPAAAPPASAAAPSEPSSAEQAGDQGPQGPLAQAVASFQAGEILKAYALVEGRLDEVPDDTGASAFLERLQPILAKELDTRVGPLTATPRIAVTEDVLMWLHLNHRAGFILSQVDGFVTFEDILDLSGMDSFSTLRILAQLLDDGVITR